MDDVEVSDAVGADREFEGLESLVTELEHGEDGVHVSGPVRVDRRDDVTGVEHEGDDLGVSDPVGGIEGLENIVRVEYEEDGVDVSDTDGVLKTTLK